MNRIPLGALALLTATTVAPGAIDFVDATASNTTLADGTPLNLVASSPANPEDYTSSGSSDVPDNHWHFRTGFGEGGAIWASQAGAASDNDSPTLRTTITGLTPGTVYDVYVYYWVAGFNTWPTPGGTPTGNNRWDLRAGLDEFTMLDLGYGLAGSGNLEGLGGAGHFTTTVLTEEGNRRLHQAKVGAAAADGSGNLLVYVDDFPGNANRTWFEGVGTELSTSAIWDGGGGDGLWSSGANWLGDLPPAPGSNLVFTGFDNAINENDLPTGTSFDGLLFDPGASAFEISGNGLTLSGDLVSQAYELQTLGLPITLDGDRTALVSDEFGGVVVTGGIAGAYGLTKDGPGYLELAGPNTYTGGLTVRQGPVYLAEDQTGATGSLVVGPFSNAPVTVTVDPFAGLRIDALSTVQIGNTVASGTTSPLLSVLGMVENDGELYVGRVGTLDIDAGTWIQSGPASLNGIGGYSCNLNVLPGGVLAYGGTTPFQLNGADANSGQALLNIPGGTLQTGRGFEQVTTPTTGFGRLTLEAGGTLKLLADIPVLTSGVRIRLGDGGGVVDTAGFSTTTDSPIAGPGSLTKSDAGTLTLTGACTYTGDTIVDAGTLQLDQAFLADGADVHLATGATLVLAHGATDVIDELHIDGTPQDAGTWGAPGSGAMHESALLAGSGLLEVTTGPTVPGFAAWASGLGLSGDPDDDSDQDGVKDGVEYVLGTDPTTPSPSPVIVADLGSDTEFRFPRDDASETPDIAVTVEVGTDLATWPTVFQVGADTASSGPGVEVVENGASADTIIVTVPKAGDPSKFGRLNVTVTP